MRKLVAVTVLVLAASCSQRTEQLPLTTKSAALGERHGRHLLLTLAIDATSLTLVQQTPVAEPLPRLRVAEPHPWLVELRGADDAVLFDARIPAQNLLRGEFDEGAGKLRGTHRLQSRAMFQLRVPEAAGRLVLTAPRNTLSLEDPRREGPGTHVTVGSVEVSP